MATATQTVTHTPGNWRVCGDRLEIRAFNGRDSVQIVESVEPQQCGQTPVGNDEAWANAQLMAAAPELLDALKNLLAYANGYSDKMLEIGRGAEELGTGADSVSVAGMARMAIARAESR